MSRPEDSGGQVWFYGHVVPRTQAAEPAAGDRGRVSLMM